MNTGIDSLRRHIEGEIVGQSHLIERLMVGLLSGGHVLIEGVPGLAKTTAVRALAGGLALGFQRIQFTPDMIPGDITGSDIYLPQEGLFRFSPGPVFSDIVLADEINRAPPKVQSALLEAMQERQITVGGNSHALSDVFMVIATQNPLEQEGTYPLPEAQLDRFQLKIRVDYPSAEDELRMLRLDRERDGGKRDAAATLTRADLLAARRAVRETYLDEMLERYIVALVGTTRAAAGRDEELATWLAHGASPRASLALAHAARARAVLGGRDFVEPDDIVALAPEVLGHRIGLTFTARAAGIDERQAVARILACVPIP
jgi:MoxR-like ATPase